ncbi:MAG: type III-A CRISPR-associated RAMP protein Csm4 [Chitinophagaceae bacterium]|nr:type III-A CRISPR-associated RAMP protein Csm4 [Chitinophagaceae bacterium]
MLHLFKMHFNSPLHVSRGLDTFDKSDVVFHSDALKSALYVAGFPYFEEWQQNKDAFFQSFRISSCFPFCKEEYFFPRPALSVKLDFEGVEISKSAKKAKKIEFLSHRLFEEFIRKSVLNIEERILQLSPEQITPDGLFVCEKAETASQRFFVSQVQVRVVVPRDGKDEAVPYYVDRIYFNEGCGLFFLAQFDNETIKQQIIFALSQLSHFGIGTDRSVGNGFFTFQPENDVIPFEFRFSSSSGKYVNLGLYLPDKEELPHIDFSQSYWEFIKRGGYIASGGEPRFRSLRKKTVWMFTAGSIFQSTVPLKGKCIDVRPDSNEKDLHPVWRDGQPLFVSF